MKESHKKLNFREFDLNLKFQKEITKDKNILEIGFGTGIFLEYLNNHGFKNVSGLEISQECYEYTKKNTTYNLFLESDLTAFSTANFDRFDCIVLFDVLEHIKKDDLIDFLENLKKMLKEDGFIFIRVPNSTNPFNQGHWGDITHEFFYNQQSLKQVLSVANLKIIELKGWEDEDILFKSKITNFTAKILTFMIKIFLGMLRTHQILDNSFNRNLYAKVSKS